jgi:hypothetical protein
MQTAAALLQRKDEIKHETMDWWRTEYRKVIAIRQSVSCPTA